MFHTLGIPELWLNPRVGQPPALRYSVAAQMGTRRVTPTAAEAVLILNRRLALVCLIACRREPASPPVSCSATAAISCPGESAPVAVTGCSLVTQALAHARRARARSASEPPGC